MKYEDEKQGELQSLLNEILKDKNENLTPENLKKGVEVLGVSGTLEQNIGIDTSDATAIAENIQKGKTAYAKGQKITGTMSIWENWQQVGGDKVVYEDSFSDGGRLSIYITDNQKSNILYKGLTLCPHIFGNKVAPVIGLTAEKITKGNTIMGVVGTGGLDTSDATAVADDIKFGKTAYVQDQKLTGTYVPIDINDYFKKDAEIIDIYNFNYLTGNKLSYYLITKIPEINTTGIRYFNYMFYSMRKLEEIPMMDTSSMTNAGYMFAFCKNITTIPELDFSNCTNMDYCFSYCEKLQNIPYINTQNITTMQHTFERCVTLEEMPELNTSQVKNFTSTFSECIKLKSIPTSIDTSVATTLDSMFSSCKEITSIHLLNLSKATRAQYMFSDCINLREVPLFNTPVLGGINYMFQNCTSLTEIPAFSFIAASTAPYVFSGCTALTTVPVLSFPKATSLQQIFNNCPSLSDDSLNNIMQICINSTKITNSTYKTLKYIGLSEEQATRCTSLENYELFTAAGWKTGY